MDGGDCGQICHLCAQSGVFGADCEVDVHGDCEIGKNMISIEEEEIRGGMELMFTDGISAARSAGLDRRAVSVWQGRG